MKNKNTLTNDKNGLILALKTVAVNGWRYDQWRITSTKLSKYDTE